MESLLTGFLIIVGGYDLYLVFKKKHTISQKVHDWFTGDKKWLDYVILCSILGLTWWVFGQAAFNRVMIGTILGHWFWNE